MALVRIRVPVSDRVLRRARAQAKREGMTVHEVCVRYLRDYAAGAASPRGRATRRRS